MSGQQVVEDWKPTDSEVYASVRNNALEEAATLLEGWDCPYAAIAAVRALKSGAE